MIEHNGIDTNKLISNSQASAINKYKNLKHKMLKYNTNIYFNKKYLEKDPVLNYAKIKIRKLSHVFKCIQKETHELGLKYKLNFSILRKEN